MAIYSLLKQLIDDKKTAAVATIFQAGPEFFPGKKLLFSETGLCGGKVYAGTDQEIARKVLPLLDKGGFTLERCELSGGRHFDFFVQPFLPPPRLVILGGGHVGAALSRMAALLDYEIVVIDDRPSFCSLERHPHAHLLICDDFSQALDKLATTISDYLVIVTRGHRHDRRCLEQVLGKKVAYIGMIGSKQRIEAQLKELADLGYEQQSLDQVFAPIGLDIGAVTESEIALSILAEITRVRRSRSSDQALQLEVLDQLAALEESRGQAVLATVIRTYGSTPRKAGTWMLIHPDGRINGTVGGGCSEAEVRREALSLMGKAETKIYRINLTSDTATEEGMACGGRMDLFIDPLAELRQPS